MKAQKLSAFADPTCRIVHFSITAESAPCTLPRIVELFALRGITPEKVSACKYNGGNLAIEVYVKGLSAHEQSVIAQKITTHISVLCVSQEVLLSFTPQRLAS